MYLLKKFQELTMWISEDETIQSEWIEGIVVTIYARGKETYACSKHLGILLLNVSYNIFSIAFNNRLAPYVENRLGDYTKEVSTTTGQL